MDGPLQGEGRQGTGSGGGVGLGELTEPGQQRGLWGLRTESSLNAAPGGGLHGHPERAQLWAGL